MSRLPQRPLSARPFADTYGAPHHSQHHRRIAPVATNSTLVASPRGGAEGSGAIAAARRLPASRPSTASTSRSASTRSPRVENSLLHHVMDDMIPWKPNEVKSGIDHFETVDEHKRSGAGTHVESVGAAIACLAGSDFAAAHRHFRRAESAITAELNAFRLRNYRGSMDHVEQKAWLQACKYFTNFGVTAACCGLWTEASRLVELATHAAEKLRDADLLGGLAASLLQSCRCNKVILDRLRDEEDSCGNAVDVGSRREPRSSSSMAEEFFMFLPPRSADGDTHQRTAASVTPQQVSRLLTARDGAEEKAKVVDPVATNSIPDEVAVLLVDSMISNARSLYALERVTSKHAKLRIIVSRARLVDELSLFFGPSMDSDDLNRQLEMSVSGETAIDGGRGGVTNDVLSTFFERACADLFSLCSPKCETAECPVSPSPIWFTFGVLLVKCFVEGRSYAPLKTLFRVKSWRRFLFPLLSEKLPVNLALAQEALLTDLQLLEESSANSSAGADQTFFCRSVESYISEDGWQDGLDGYVSFLALEKARAACGIMNGESQQDKKLLTAYAFCSQVVVDSKRDILIAIRTGMEFGGNLIRDEVLRRLLGLESPQQDAVVPSEPLRQAAVKQFARAISGGSDDADVDPRNIVSILEFRGWGASTTTPYYLCAWLHHRSTVVQRRQFLLLCTGMTALSSTGGAFQQKIMVVQSPTHFYAKTCFFTLYVPFWWEQATMDDVWMCLDAAMASLVTDRVMTEVDPTSP